MSNIKREELEATTNRLYSIEGDCPPELAQVFDLLRQLINEEFVHKSAFITSQNLYDVLYPKITKYSQGKVEEAVVATFGKLLEEVGRTSYGTPVYNHIGNRLAAAKAQLADIKEKK